MTAIHLISEPEINPTDQWHWELVLWVGQDRYPTIPFRHFIEQIAALYPTDTASVALPPAKHDEDFVCGTLRVKETELALYWEQSPLAFLSISNASREVLEDLRVKLGQLVSVTLQNA